jgi:hypothetical protein
MDSTAQTAPLASEIITKNASRGDAWIRQRKQPYGLRNLQKTASTVDEWIRQRKQPLRPQKYSSKLLPLVTPGFDSANSPCGLEIITEN